MPTLIGMNFLISINDIKKNFFKKENIYFFFLITIIFSLDRTSKLGIINNYSERPYYVNDFINLDLIWNTGIGFGFLSTQSSLLYNFVTVIIFVIIAILFLFLINSKNLDKLIFASIIGGAIGNFYDRLIFKAVPDFIDLHYNNFHWFTFNVADIFITIGILIFMMKGLFTRE